MSQYRIVSTRTGFAIGLTASVALCSSAAFAEGGDAPGTGPVIFGFEIELEGPYLISGDTSDNTDQFDVGVVTNPPTDCAPSNAPDEWYTLIVGVVTQNLDIEVDLCSRGGTSFDSQIYVLDNFEVARQCNDDETGCTTPGLGPSTITRLHLGQGVYELGIDGAGTSAGPYSGEIRVFTPIACLLDPPCFGSLESELCDVFALEDTVNGGCNSTPNVFSSITVGSSVCGFTWAHDERRDTDWWHFTANTQLNLMIDLRSEVDTVAFLAELSPGGTCPIQSIPSGTYAFSGGCEATHIVGGPFTVSAGDYALFIAPGQPDGSGLYDGFPCPFSSSANGLPGTNNQYHAQLLLGPPSPEPGACCFGQSCADDTLPDDCTMSGGTFLGARTLCEPRSCTSASGACCNTGGFCLEVTEATCDGFGATFLGAGTDCTGPNPCGLACPGDVNDNGVVDFADILAIIAAWGPCNGAACPADLSGNDQVDFADILAVIAAWGRCP